MSRSAKRRVAILEKKDTYATILQTVAKVAMYDLKRLLKRYGRKTRHRR